MDRWYLIRHAQTEWNEQNRLQGGTDRPLSTTGKGQADCVGEWSRSVHLDTIVTSAMKRAQETAEPMINSNGHTANTIIEPDLNEMNLGDWEGLTPEEIDVNFDGAYSKWREQVSAVQLPAAESLDAFRTRIRKVVFDLRKRLDKKSCAIVTHGGVIASILADTLDADYDVLLRRLQIDNGGITTIDYSSGIPQVLFVNETKHMSALS